MLPKSIKQYSDIISDYTPREYGDPHFVELTPGYKWDFSGHVASFDTLAEALKELKKVVPCNCGECNAILNHIA